MTYSRKTLEIGLDQLLCIEMLIILKIKTRRMHCKVKYKYARNFVFEYEGMPKMPGILTRCKRVLLVFLDYS